MFSFTLFRLNHPAAAAATRNQLLGLDEHVMHSLSILLSWANSSTFILTYGQRGPSKPSHLEITDLIQFVYNRLFRVLTTVLHISHPHTQTHASYAHEVATVNHFGRTVTPYFAFFFMLCHTRPLSRIYVFVLIRTAAVDGAACR
jgi:hypothetical protein